MFSRGIRALNLASGQRNLCAENFRGLAGPRDLECVDAI